MDPNFVQHAMTDIFARFFGYLVFILAYSTLIHGAVQAMFRVFGLTLADTIWDEICIGSLGIFFGLALNLNGFFYIGGVTDEQFVQALPVMKAFGVPAGYLGATLVIFMCNVTTGAMVVGGRRTVVAMADEFSKGFAAIKAAMDRK